VGADKGHNREDGELGHENGKIERAQLIELFSNIGALLDGTQTVKGKTCVHTKKKVRKKRKTPRELWNAEILGLTG